MDIKNFTNGKGMAKGLGGKKITRTVPILKSNSTSFTFKYHISMMDIEIFTNGRKGGVWVGVEPAIVVNVVIEACNNYDVAKAVTQKQM